MTFIYWTVDWIKMIKIWTTAKDKVIDVLDIIEERWWRVIAMFDSCIDCEEL